MCTKRYREIWSVTFIQDLKNLDESTVKNLDQERKIEILRHWEEFVWNENAQNTEERLLNIRNLPEIQTKIPLWVMDRLKEAMRQYVDGQWFSSIVLCGAMVEFIAREYAIVSEDSFPKGHSATDHLKRSLEMLAKRSIISDDDYESLDQIRNIRNKYVHLKTLDRDRNSLKGDNLLVLRDLISFVTKNPRELTLQAK